MDNFGSSTNTTDQSTELYLKKVMAGKIEDVRLRLISSMESMGYDIIEEEPNIIGRRGARGWATSMASADVLDYPMTLTLRLKSLGDSSTRATFDYLIKHPILNRGEKKIVVQEAKTIAAISKIQSIEKTCSVCETESTDDSRFCRKCGAPLTSEHAELEVLRLMAETRAGKTSVVTSSVLTLISTVLLFLVFLLNSADLIKPKGAMLLFAFGFLGLLGGVVSSFFGWNRLKRALDVPEAQPINSPRQFSGSIETGERQALPPRRVPASVTEGTTNLLDERLIDGREKVPVSNRRETNDLE